MKLKPQILLLMILMAFTLLVTDSPLMAEVYKTVDKDGNVSYTDRPPGDGTKPMDLPPLSIVETPVYEKTARETAATTEASEEQDPEIPLRTLRRTYRDFAIISPVAEESVWHPEQQMVPIAWSVGNPLQPGMTVTIYVDGKKQAATTQPVIPVAGLERGEHTVSAELKDAKNRKIATAQAVTFFIRQPNIYTNRARPRG